MQIDYSRDSLLTDFGRATLKDRYLLPEETSPQEAFARAAKAFADDEDHAQRIYDYVSKLYFMFSTPILSNGGTSRGLSISCFLQYVPDSREGLTDHYTENAFLSSFGGGTAGYWGAIRADGATTSKGSRSSGTIPFLKVVDSSIMAFAQGVSRRASYAAYQDISHPEIEEFINIRKPTGGDINRKALNIHNAVCLTDHFMRLVEGGGDLDLTDPHSGTVTKSISARRLWEQILETRISTGEPYITFIDEANKQLPQSQKDLGLKIHSSNLCEEIYLPTSEERTAVCCLSSVNLEKWEEWKDIPGFIEDIVRFLDNVLTHFIAEAPPQLHKAKFSASQERSIGLGAMGFHSYLQKNSIPFEGPIAAGVNQTMFKYIKQQALKATEKLAEERGSPPDAGGRKIRNLHLLAIAPNASSGIICGETSPSIEPLRANAFTQKTLSGSFLVRNKYLEELLVKYDKNTPETWTSIVAARGSIQHLNFLTDWEKDVFKTAIELDQHWIIEHASQRQPYICQSQSVNLFFTPDVDVEYLHSVHMMAWKKKLKSLYYLRSQSMSAFTVVSEKIEKMYRRESEEACISCEG